MSRLSFELCGEFIAVRNAFVEFGAPFFALRNEFAIARIERSVHFRAAETQRIGFCESLGGWLSAVSLALALLCPAFHQSEVCPFPLRELRRKCVSSSEIEVSFI